MACFISRHANTRLAEADPTATHPPWGCRDAATALSIPLLTLR